MANKSFLNKVEASEAGKKSSRKNIKNKKTLLTEYLIEKANARKRGEKLLTMEDLKADSPYVWLWLRENASNLQEVLLCESHLSKYLHSVKSEVTGKDGKSLFEGIEITVVRSDGKTED